MKQLIILTSTQGKTRAEAVQEVMDGMAKFEKVKAQALSEMEAENQATTEKQPPTKP